MNWNLTMANGSVRDVIHSRSKPITVNSLKSEAVTRSFHFQLEPTMMVSSENGKTSGTVRPMPMHGFAREGTFN